MLHGTWSRQRCSTETRVIFAKKWLLWILGKPAAPKRTPIGCDHRPLHRPPLPSASLTRSNGSGTGISEIWKPAGMAFRAIRRPHACGATAALGRTGMPWQGPTLWPSWPSCWWQCRNHMCKQLSVTPLNSQYPPRVTEVKVSQRGALYRSSTHLLQQSTPMPHRANAKSPCFTLLCSILGSKRHNFKLHIHCVRRTVSQPAVGQANLPCWVMLLLRQRQTLSTGGPWTLHARCSAPPACPPA